MMVSLPSGEISVRWRADCRAFGSAISVPGEAPTGDRFALTDGRFRVCCAMLRPAILVQVVAI